MAQWETRASIAFCLKILKGLAALLKVKCRYMRDNKSVKFVFIEHDSQTGEREEQLTA